MTWMPEFELGTLAYAGVFLGALIAFEGARQAAGLTCTWLGVNVLIMRSSGLPPTPSRP